MAPLVDKEFVERANKVLFLGILWTGLAGLIICALAYDMAYGLQTWWGPPSGRTASLFELRRSLQSDPASPRDLPRGPHLFSARSRRPSRRQIEWRAHLGGI